MDDECKLDLEGLGRRVEWARKKAGVSGYELDKLAGFLGRGITRLIETGARKHVEAKTAFCIAEQLGVTTDWLLSGQGSPPSESKIKAAIKASRERRAARGA